MKQIILTLVLIVLILSPVMGAINAEHKCVNYLCPEGEPVEFYYEVYNNLNRSILVTDFVIADTRNATRLVEVQDEVVIGPNETYSFNVTRRLGLPDSGFTYYYHPCIQVAFMEGNLTGRYVCGEVERTITLTPEEKLQCRNDEGCETDQYCDMNTNKCVPLNCADDEALVNHKCFELACAPDEQAINHTCVKQESEMDYGLIIVGAILVIIILIILFYSLTDKVIIFEGQKKKTKRRRI